MRTRRLSRRLLSVRTLHTRTRATHLTAQRCTFRPRPEPGAIPTVELACTENEITITAMFDIEEGDELVTSAGYATSADLLQKFGRVEPE